MTDQNPTLPGAEAHSDHDTLLVVSVHRVDLIPQTQQDASDRVGTVCPASHDDAATGQTLHGREPCGAGSHVVDTNCQETVLTRTTSRPAKDTSATAESDRTTEPQTETKDDGHTHSAHTHVIRR